MGKKLYTMAMHVFNGVPNKAIHFGKLNIEKNKLQYHHPEIKLTNMLKRNL